MIPIAKLSGYALLASLAGLPVAAFAVPPAADQRAEQGKDDPDRLVCRRDTETGSRLKAQRVCMTRAQWDEQRRQSRQSIERSQTQTRVETPEG